MGTVDLWIWILIGGMSAAVPLAAATAVYRTSGAKRVRTAAIVGGAFGGWLLLVAALGGAGILRVADGGALPLIAPAVAIPISAGILLSRSQRVVDAMTAIPQTWLLAAQAPRVLGVTFLVLYAQGKLPGHFALSAGIGDILVGLAALPVAWYFARRSPGASGVAVGFNLVGLADLVLAIGTGFLSAPGPVRLFVTDPSTELMTVLPMVLVPAFLVPSLVFVHVLSLRKLLSARTAGAGPIGRAAVPGAG